MSGLLIGLVATAGFILGVRVGLALARRQEAKKKRARAVRPKSA